MVRAGLLGELLPAAEGVQAGWTDSTGRPRRVVCSTEAEAVALVARHAAGGLRFHDLRHSYATWLVTEGVPVNVVRKVMGHEQVSTTLDMYTHTPDDYEQRVTAALDGHAAFVLPPADDEPSPEGDEDDTDDL